MLELTLPQTQRLWIVPDNGVYTTINVRGEATPEGSIAFNPNFVYGTADTPVVQPDPNSDQCVLLAWRGGGR